MGATFESLGLEKSSALISTNLSDKNIMNAKKVLVLGDLFYPDWLPQKEDTLWTVFDIALNKIEAEMDRPIMKNNGMVMNSICWEHLDDIFPGWKDPCGGPDYVPALGDDGRYFIWTAFFYIDENIPNDSIYFFAEEGWDGEKFDPKLVIKIEITTD